MFKWDIFKNNKLLLKKWKKSFDDTLIKVLLVIAYIIFFINKNCYLISFSILLSVLLFTFVFAKSELEFELNQKNNVKGECL